MNTKYHVKVYLVPVYDRGDAPGDQSERSVREKKNVQCLQGFCTVRMPFVFGSAHQPRLGDNNLELLA